MSFLHTIFDNLANNPDLTKVSEIHLTTPRGTDGNGMLELIRRARGFYRSNGVQEGDRVAQLAGNSVRWIASDLATLAEGAIAVPMFDRSTPDELGKVLRSAEPKLVIVANDELRQTAEEAWPDRGQTRIATHAEVFEHEPLDADIPICEVAAEQTILVIYTSGTSGEPKGVQLTRANLDFMIPQLIERMGTVVKPKSEPDRIFHFLPFCFAASRLMMWVQLSRPNPIMLSTDISKMQAELATAAPNYFLTVPMVLERLKSGVADGIANKGNVVRGLYARAIKAHAAIVEGKGSVVDSATLALARAIIFKAVLAKIGPNLEFVISGSAPLAEETQRWFQMLGVPIYQAYGLTETTGIVSLDEPDKVVPGRVGHAIEGVQTKLSDEGELLVAGPHIFDGYWNNPEATAKAMEGEWFRTGDQVEIVDGNLKIIGRIKNLIIPESGHNVAPEPLEEQFSLLCPKAAQCVIIGHGKPFLTIIATGNPPKAEVEAAIKTFNESQPYFKKIKSSIVIEEPLSSDSGLLTANLKLRRAKIEAHFKAEIDAVYEAYFAEKKAREGKKGASA